MIRYLPVLAAGLAAILISPVLAHGGALISDPPGDLAIITGIFGFFLALWIRERQRAGFLAGAPRIIRAGIIVLLIVGFPVTTYTVVSAVAPVSRQVSTVAVDQDPTLSICLEGSPTMAQILSVKLEIYINGELPPLPPNLGISPTCTRPIHTHLGYDGIVWAESPVTYSFTLGDFFMVWGKPFNSTTVLGCHAVSSFQISMIVNGQPSHVFDSHILRNGDSIVIRCP